MVKQDGTVFWVRVAATTAPGPATSPPEATESAPLSRVVLSDITELKRVEEEKAELAAQLQRVRKHHTLRPGPNKGGTAATKK